MGKREGPNLGMGMGKGGDCPKFGWKRRWGGEGAIVQT